LTKSHLPMIASSLEHGLGVDARYLKSPETKSGSAAKTQQQQIREYKCTP
jgi:hypothetical protein